MGKNGFHPAFLAAISHLKDVSSLYMRNVLNLFLVLLFSIPSNAQLLWESRKPIPHAGRHEAATFTIDGKVYVGMGREHGVGYVDELWMYDPATDEWEPRADFPGTGLFSASAFVIGSKGYVICGATTSNAGTTQCYEYDPAQDVWTSKASFPGTARFGVVAFGLGGYGFAGLGRVGTTFFSDLYRYNPTTNTWTSMSSYPGAAGSHGAVFTIGSNAYIGNLTTSGNSPSNAFYRYNLGSNNWSAIASLPDSARRLTAAFTVDGEGYVGCGTTSGSPVVVFMNDFYRYSVTGNSWTHFSSNANFTPKAAPRMVSIGDSAVYCLHGTSEDGEISELWYLNLDLDTCDYYDTTYVSVFDTTYVNVYDTTFVTIYDTTYVNVYDTTYVDVYDTTFLTIYDTTHVLINDTTVVTVYDTTVVYDTLYTVVYDTLQITDTIYYRVAVSDTLKVQLFDSSSGCSGYFIYFYPNPASEILYVYTQRLNCLVGHNVQLVTKLGQVLFDQPFDQSYLSIDLRPLARGPYILRIVDPNGGNRLSRILIVQ